MRRSKFKQALAALSLAAMPLATAVSCDPYEGFSFFRFDEDEGYDSYYDGYYYTDGYYDDYYYDDCFYGCY